MLIHLHAKNIEYRGSQVAQQKTVRVQIIKISLWSHVWVQEEKTDADLWVSIRSNLKSSPKKSRVLEEAFVCFNPIW